MEIPCIYNVEGNIRLSFGRQPLTTGSMLKFRPKQAGFGNYFVVFYKTNH